MKPIIELFSGNADITKALNAKGLSCVSLDYDASKSPDIVADVYGLAPDFLQSFAFIWASPDCTTYSLASHGKHRIKGGAPVSEYAKQCDANNAQLIALLKKWIYPSSLRTRADIFAICRSCSLCTAVACITRNTARLIPSRQIYSAIGLSRNTSTQGRNTQNCIWIIADRIKIFSGVAKFRNC